MMNIQAALKNQYHAGLSMLIEAIEACPPGVWVRPMAPAAFWHLAYHTLFYTDLYLRPSKATFVPWEWHRPDYQRLAQVHPEALVPYSTDALASYAVRCKGIVDDAVDQLDLAAPTSGFSFYPMPKIEHQFLNLRHLQHHTGQLAEALQSRAGTAVAWRGTR